jgi:threonine aldolase
MDSSFASDNAAGIHPDVLAAIAQANTGCATGYGNDQWTNDAVSHVQRHFGSDAEPLFVFGGTGANIVALAALRESFHAVVCAQTSHLWNDECAAPEHFLGGKLIPVPTVDGKLTAEAIQRAVPDLPAEHHAQPRVLSVAQPTELGTVYTVDELAALTGLARERGWRVHVDGARLSNAAAALDVPLSAFGSEAGIHALSFGATKNGALGAEAVVLFDAATAKRARFYRKQASQLASKLRFISAQITALLDGDLWRRCAAHANDMASRLATALAAIPDAELACPADTNAVFFRLSAPALAQLQRRYRLVVWDRDSRLVRAMTSWATAADDVDEFAAAVRSATNAPG